jgi:hypothetical protein
MKFYSADIEMLMSGWNTLTRLVMRGPGEMFVDMFQTQDVDTDNKRHLNESLQSIPASHLEGIRTPSVPPSSEQNKTATNKTSNKGNSGPSSESQCLCQASS